MVQTEIIVTVGCDGGSLTIEGEHYGDTRWQFRGVRNEVALYDDFVEDGEPEDITGFLEKTNRFDSLGEALKLFDRYPYWIDMYVVEVHPDFVDEVLAEVRSRGGTSAEARWREELDGRRRESWPPSPNQQLSSGTAPSAPGTYPPPNVREIHVDFLLEEEFNVSPDFLDCFVRADGRGQGSPFKAESVKRSTADQFAEVDLLVVYKGVGGSGDCTAILIEDKIGAGFQPDQAKRYRQRGEYGKGHEWSDYWTCLVAPESYMTEKAKDGFDAAITLEQIKEWIAAGEPARHPFKADVIQAAIDKAERLGPQEVDKPVTEFRIRYFNLLREFFANRSGDVQMRAPAPSWKGETWFRIKSPLLPRGAYIHHKAPNGFVDLTFPSTDAILLEGAKSLLEPAMSIEQTGKSAAVRLQVEAITAFGSFDQERAKVEEAFVSVERLLSFYVREQNRLHPILISAKTVSAHR